MELFTREVDGQEVKARCYYNESKVAVTSDGSISRKQFFWGEDEMFRDELEAIKAASTYVDGLVEME